MCDPFQPLPVAIKVFVVMMALPISSYRFLMTATTTQTHAAAMLGMQTMLVLHMVLQRALYILSVVLVRICNWVCTATFT